MTKYDYAIIGAGPAGLCAAYGLIKKNPNLKIVIIDKGKNIKERICTRELGVCACKPCNILCGVGGAGGKSDGKLLFNPPTDGDMYRLGTKDEIFRYIDTVRDFFRKYSQVQVVSGVDQAKSDLQYLCTQNGLRFVVYDEVHIGSDALGGVMDSIYKDLLVAGVEFLLETSFLKFCCDRALLVETRNGGNLWIHATKTVFAMGRYGSILVQELVNRGVISSTPKPVDVGVRVETRNSITEHITEIQHDFKIISRYRDFMVRSFCVNPGGFVANERHEEFNLVNGHSERNRKSENCNFAVLFKAELTRPASDTTAYGRNIAKVFNDLGNGNPIVQRLQDVYDGRRSTANRISRSSVVPTLSAVPGDLRWGMPSIILDATLDYIKKLDKIAPGIADGYNTLLYAPEIKFQCTRLKLNRDFSSVLDDSIHFIGDCSGYTGSIVSAAAMGFMLADRLGL